MQEQQINMYLVERIQLTGIYETDKDLDTLLTQMHFSIYVSLLHMCIG